jgi:hypothetical protein
MNRGSIKGEGLFFLFLLGVFLFNPPLLSVFDIPHRLFGIPLLYIYLFACWGALLVLVAVMMERGNAGTQPPNSGTRPTGEDGTS